MLKINALWLSHIKINDYLYIRKSETYTQNSKKMKTRWNLAVDSTKQVLGGYLELTQEMTEKQMIAYVRKIGRQLMLTDKGIDRYGILVEDDANDDHSFHITFDRHGSYIDVLAYDSQKNELLLDTWKERREKEEREYQEEMRKFNEAYGIC